MSVTLPDYIEHIYPDYSLYDSNDSSYGYMTRGCPRGCNFCIVKDKEDDKSVKVADLSEFWHGQQEIILLDPNLLACSEREDLLIQLTASGSWVDFTQGLDARLLTEDIAYMLRGIKLKMVHFAFDKMDDNDIILDRLKMFKEITKYPYNKLGVYALFGFDTDIEQDLYRITRSVIWGLTLTL